MNYREDSHLSREFLANPNSHIPFYEQLKKKKTVDLRNNGILIDFENGYDEIIPKDSNKFFK